MSFFIKGKRSASNSRFGKKSIKKRKLTRPPQHDDDDLTSSSEEELQEAARRDSIDSSDNENETAQEKKLRLAKIYLQEIEKREQEKSSNEDQGDGSVANALKEDYLRETAKLHRDVANTYTGADVQNITVLKSKDHRSSITSLCLSEKFIFSGSKDGSIVKWAVEDCKKVGCIPYAKQHLISNKITGHMKMITSLAVTTDERFLAASDTSSNIQIWDPNTLSHVHTLKGHQHSVTGLTFRKNTHTLYSGSKDRSVKVWSLDEMAYIETLYGHHSPITSIDALTRERAITSGGMDGSIRIWKIVEESQLIYNGPSSSIDVVKLLNEETFVSGGDDGVINIWGVNKKKPLCCFKDAHGCNPSNNEPYWISSIATLVNTDLIASGSQNGFIKLWKLGDNFKTISLLFSIPVTGFVNNMVFTMDGKHLIVAVGSEHKMGRWNVIRDAKNSILKIPLLISK